MSRPALSRACLSRAYLSRMGRQLRALRADARGATIVEFAFVAPVLIGMMLGMFQIGIGMQQYNALRNVSAQAARYAVVNYQIANRLSTDQISAYARARAIAAPYMLDGTRLTIVTSMPANQRISKAVEYQLRIDYTLRTKVPMLRVPDITMSFTRPIFVPQ